MTVIPGLYTNSTTYKLGYVGVVLLHLKSRRIGCSIRSTARVLLGPEGLLMR